MVAVLGKSPRSYLKELKKRKEELEKEMENLMKMRERGEISEKEFEENKRRIEREFVEIMDKIVQLRYLAGEEQLFG